MLAKKNKNTIVVFDIITTEVEIRKINTTYSKNNTTVKSTTEKKTKQYATRLETIKNEKLREGYMIIPDDDYDYDALSKIVLVTKTNAFGYIMPQKAYPFEYDRMTYPAYCERKYNGVRGSSTYVKDTTEGVGLFDEFVPERVALFNKTGQELDIKHIAKELLEIYNLVNEVYPEIGVYDFPFDGEFYIHGLPLGRINGATTNPSNENHSRLTFVIFDIKLECSQTERVGLLWMISNIVKNSYPHIEFSEKHHILNDSGALKLRDEFIEEGYEGCIIRSSHHNYTSGRTWDMMKYKVVKRGYAKIIDIIPYELDNLQGKLVVEDMENYTVIETVLRSQGKTTLIREEMLKNKQNYIGKTITIEYRERTETGKMFHTNAIYETLK